jgi:ribosomal protein S27E
MSKFKCPECNGRYICYSELEIKFTCPPIESEYKSESED